MKLSDYIADFLVSRNIKTVFLITGGAIAHVVDSIGKRKQEQGDLDYIVVQHEQAGAMAAEAYSRFGPGLGVMMATSGPGATNLITGICGCWFDSVPALFITGQVGSKESLDAAAAKPRQVGFQETDIVAIAQSVTKYAVKITDPSQIRFELEKAMYIAQEGRPGPVLVDIPVNIQFEQIDPASLAAFTPESYARTAVETDAEVAQKIQTLTGLIAAAERPVLLLGGGVRLARAEGEALALAEKLNIPVVVSWSGFDLIPHDHPLFAGHIGVYGNRGGNLVVQNADLVIALGSRLDTRQTGGKVDSFARGAKIVMVEIDRNEIEKGRGLRTDLGIVADVKTFIPKLASAISVREPLAVWQERVAAWKEKYGGSVETTTPGGLMNAYDFLHILSDTLPEGQTTIVDEGGNLVWTMQSFSIKKGQRLVSTFGNSPMGYALPAAIGAAAALPGKDIICIDGDGGFQMNIQELQTLAHYQLPVKIFIMNNRCMGIIKQFQDLYFESRYIATTDDGGYSVPDFVKIAAAYGLATFTVNDLSEADRIIKKAIATPGPVLVDVRIDPEQKLNPKLEFGRPIEDMAPYLDRAELKETMIVPLLPESEKLPEKTGWVNLK